MIEQLLAVDPRDRDAWIDELLGLDAPPDDEALPRGAVPYLPCGVDEILAAVQEAPVRAEDVLVDIGAGVGRVAMLVHLLTGARTLGIELQAPLVAIARARAAAMQLPVEFIHANAAEIALAGTVFFLYAPCNGELLARVLARIHAARPRVICAVGLELDVPWLRPRPSSRLALTFYDAAPNE